MHSWLQTADRETITRFQLARLRIGLDRALQSNQFLQRKLNGFDTRSLANMDGFASMPFTHKQELVEDQRAYPPYGTNLTFSPHDYVRLHQTSGTMGQPMTILDTAESWDWWADCWTAVYHAAGVGREDIVYLAFSFGPFIGFWSAYGGGPSGLARWSFRAAGNLPHTTSRECRRPAPPCSSAHRPMRCAWRR